MYAGTAQGQRSGAIAPTGAMPGTAAHPTVTPGVGSPGVTGTALGGTGVAGTGVTGTGIGVAGAGVPTTGVQTTGIPNPGMIGTGIPGTGVPGTGFGATGTAGTGFTGTGVAGTGTGVAGTPLQPQIQFSPSGANPSTNATRTGPGFGTDIQNYPTGTYHGYFQTQYPNNFLTPTPYQMPGTSGTQADLGRATYIPPYAPEYPYAQPTTIPGENSGPVAVFPYDSGRLGQTMIGRQPQNVPEVLGNLAELDSARLGSAAATLGSASRNDRARVRVSVPANAAVWFDTTQTQASGPVRVFQSPTLTPGDRYTYTIRARWNENGRQVTQTRTVDVSAGADVNVNFANPGAGNSGR